MNHRIFIAINLPGKVKEKLGELISELKRKNKLAPIKWVDSNILHLTLHFLGNLRDEQIEKVKQILKGRIEEKRPIELSLGLIGAFPNLREPRVIFIEAKEESGNLVKLVKELGEDLLNKGFPIDNRPWRSHITLGRVKGPSTGLRTGKLEGIDHWSSDGQKWPVESVDLMESELGSAGPQYKVVESFKL